METSEIIELTELYLYAVETLGKDKVLKCVSGSDILSAIEINIKNSFNIKPNYCGDYEIIMRHSNNQMTLSIYLFNCISFEKVKYFIKMLDGQD